MKIKKIVVSILSAVFITSTLVGCGSNTTSTESSTGNNSNGEVVTLTILLGEAQRNLRLKLMPLKSSKRIIPILRLSFSIYQQIMILN